jgi:hypothetical protein
VHSPDTLISRIFPELSFSLAGIFPEQEKE